MLTKVTKLRAAKRPDAERDSILVKFEAKQLAVEAKQKTREANLARKSIENGAGSISLSLSRTQERKAHLRANVFFASQAQDLISKTGKWSEELLLWANELNHTAREACIARSVSTVTAPGAAPEVPQVPVPATTATSPPDQHRNSVNLGLQHTSKFSPGIISEEGGARSQTFRTVTSPEQLVTARAHWMGKKMKRQAFERNGAATVGTETRDSSDCTDACESVLDSEVGSPGLGVEQEIVRSEYDTELDSDSALERVISQLFQIHTSSINLQVRKNFYDPSFHAQETTSFALRELELDENFLDWRLENLQKYLLSLSSKQQQQLEMLQQRCSNLFSEESFQGPEEEEEGEGFEKEESLFSEIQSIHTLLESLKKAWHDRKDIKNKLKSNLATNGACFAGRTLVPGNIF